jgi:hypothetical protein
MNTDAARDSVSKRNSYTGYSYTQKENSYTGRSLLKLRKFPTEEENKVTNFHVLGVPNRVPMTYVFQLFAVPPLLYSYFI